MKDIHRYLSTKISKSKIKATNETIRDIVKSELDRLGHDADLNHIDVSEVTDMMSLFSCDDVDLGFKFYDLNPDISKWDVSNVKKMDYMFYECEEFNCDISEWDVSNVEDSTEMFYKCKSFDQDLSKWNLDKNRWFMPLNMFYGCPISKEHLPKAYLDISKID